MRGEIKHTFIARRLYLNAPATSPGHRAATAEDRRRRHEALDDVDAVVAVAPREEEVVAGHRLEVRAPRPRELRHELVAARHHRIAVVVGVVDGDAILRTIGP